MKIGATSVPQSSGLSAPREGRREPVREPETQKREIVNAIKAVNESGGTGADTELRFAIDPGSGQPLVKVVDRVTNEVTGHVSLESVLRAAEILRQLHNGEALAIARRLEQDR